MQGLTTDAFTLTVIANFLAMTRGQPPAIVTYAPLLPLALLLLSGLYLIICTGETYKSTVKLTFAQGASLPDPTGLFNASLEGGTRRAIDLREGEMVNARAFTALIKAAVARNQEKAARR